MDTSTVVMAPQQQSQFDENDPKWRCCCGCCHVRTGTLILGIIEAFSVGSQLISMLNSATTSAHTTNIVSSGITIIVLVCLFWGICAEKPSLLIPHLVLQVIGMVLIGLLFIVVLILVVTDNLQGLIDYYNQLNIYGEQKQTRKRKVKMGTGTGAVILVCFGLAFGLYVWFFMIVRDCYRYLKAKEEYNRLQINAQYSGAPILQQPLIQQPPIHQQLPPPPPYGFKS